MSDEIDMMTCPGCGAIEPDHDGMGMIAHTRPAYANGCGYCTHPALRGDECEICHATPYLDERPS